MKGKRVIITISEKHFEQLNTIMKWNTPREKGKYLRLLLENHIDKLVNRNYEEKEKTGMKLYDFIENLIAKWRKPQ